LLLVTALTVDSEKTLQCARRGTSGLERFLHAFEQGDPLVLPAAILPSFNSSFQTEPSAVSLVLSV
jgi:hypothetical protein